MTLFLQSEPITISLIPYNHPFIFLERAFKYNPYRSWTIVLFFVTVVESSIRLFTRPFRNIKKSRPKKVGSHALAKTCLSQNTFSFALALNKQISSRLERVYIGIIETDRASFIFTHFRHRPKSILREPFGFCPLRTSKNTEPKVNTKL